MPRARQGPRLIEKNGGYIIRWYDNSGRLRERRLAATSLDEAKREEAIFIVGEYRRARPGGPVEPEDYSISTALSAYVDEHGIHTAQPGALASRIDNLAAFWANKSVGDIRPQACKDYLAYRLQNGLPSKRRGKDAPQTISTGTVRRELVVLRAAANHARKEGRIKYAPFVWLPPDSAPRERWLARKEVARLLIASRALKKSAGYLVPYILLSLYTGARKGAVLSLKWSQINMKTGAIDFNEPGKRNSNKLRAHIMAPPGLMWFLRKWHRRRECDFVISKNLQPIGDIKKSFALAVHKARLKDVTPHTLRHTTGTWLKHAGIQRDQIGDYLGHRSARTTARYTHSEPEWLKPVAAALHGHAKRIRGGIRGNKR